MLIDSQATGIAAAPSLSLLSLSLIAPHCNCCGRESGAGSAALSAKASDQTNQTPKAAPAASRINKWSWSGRRRRRAVVANDDTRDAACVQFAKGWCRAGCAAGGERREGEHIWKSLTTSTAEAARLWQRRRRRQRRRYRQWQLQCAVSRVATATQLLSLSPSTRRLGSDPACELRFAERG